MDCKILAKCLEGVLPAFISPGQTGFIQGGHSSNTCRLLDIMYTQNLESFSPEIIVALDAEKAFDRVDWGFLFDTLSRFGLVKLLYSGPSALVQTNEVKSSYIPLSQNNTGMPLSLLLFDLVIAPLAVP